jgi:hypothetical protein
VRASVTGHVGMLVGGGLQLTPTQALSLSAHAATLSVSDPLLAGRAASGTVVCALRGQGGEVVVIGRLTGEPQVDVIAVTFTELTPDDAALLASWGA